MKLRYLAITLALVVPYVGMAQGQRGSPNEKATKEVAEPSGKSQGGVISKEVIVEQLTRASGTGEPGAIAFSSDSILFDYGSSKLRKKSHAQLMEIAKALKDDALAHLPFLYVDGHTCSIGTDESNCILSLNRAKSVVRFLVEEGRVPVGKLRPRGFGEREPVASNDTERGRRKNRRVVLKSGFLSLKKDREKQCSLED